MLEEIYNFALIFRVDERGRVEGRDGRRYFSRAGWACYGGMRGGMGYMGKRAIGRYHQLRQAYMIELEVYYFTKEWNAGDFLFGAPKLRLYQYRAAQAGGADMRLRLLI